ncbi:TPA: hypothetical protein N0F65_002597 [Lagenidium giganteum]|uniref:Uncharacterized protein n=1 Tax=Lagenidium giganteum TaxID=4803 RepID=A0AAV2YV05_9STRA|nr:TPA: hypothetical protein N0F65_002597 [Lagenidium giganteum]
MAPAGSSAERQPLLPHEKKATPLPDAAGTSSGLGELCPSEVTGRGASVFFSWVTPLMALGNQRALQADDLYQLDPANRSSAVTELFQRQWTQERARNNRSPSLVRALLGAFGGQFALAGVLKLVHDSLQFVGPLIIKAIIAYLSDQTATTAQGFAYAGVVFVVGVVQSFALRQYTFHCFETGMHLRSAAVTAVYAKALVLSAAARQAKTTGEMINLVATDAQRLQDLPQFLHTLWLALFQIAVACYLLWQQLGVAALAGVGVIVLMVPVMAGVSRAMRALQQRLMQVKDERTKVCHELLAGIKVVKCQAWEPAFLRRVLGLRADELARLRTYILAQSGSYMVSGILPALVTVASFWTYVALGHTLDVGTALTSMALFQILRFPLFMLPQVVNNVVESSVSLERLRLFLLAEECVPVGQGNISGVGVEVRDADFQWDAAPEAVQAPALQAISLTAKAGQLHAVVGAVGAGKSTLLSGILGDAQCCRGTVAKRGSVAYVSQQPFIQNATLRDNITFGLEFDQARYDEAVRVSCLKHDLAILPDGDLTAIGDKGINLSGGQRTRVAIARAVYQDADIYLLDDILSAVDSHVGRDIFEQCIKSKLKMKLVLLVTHSLSFLDQCDRITVLGSGRIVESGSFKQLMTQQQGALAQLIATHSDHESISDHTDATDKSEDDQIEENERLRARSTLRNDGSVHDDDAQEQVATSEEDRSTGAVSWRIYRVWLDAFGGLRVALVVLTVFVCTAGTQLSTTFWISLWSEKAQQSPDSQMYYVYVYIALNSVYAALMLARELLVFLNGVRASQYLFQRLLTAIVRSPMAFFDTTPLGRIVNRLSSDVYMVDETISNTWVSMLGTLLYVVVALGTVCYVTPAFLIVLIPVAMGYRSSQRYFVQTSRELQRLEAVSRSPVLALLNETLDGLTTVRASGVQSAFVARNQQLLDENQRAYFLRMAVDCWLALRLEIVGTLIATGATLTAVAAHAASSSAQGAAFAGMVGVSLTYAFNVTSPLNWTVRVVSQLQTQMVSVERIQAFIELPSEAAFSTLTTQPPAQWPSHGVVQFDNVSLRYRPDMPRVLNHVSFTIDAQEKIGIVGRTGAGKSSLLVALFRLAELDTGRITIDGIDVGQVGLHDLRGRIAIIPQDPVLFSGTVRANIDPGDEYSDDQLWTAIKRAHLHQAIVSLDAPVDEQGANLSVGERQLLCIARALLKRSKVILMDEATASIDTETNRKIQQSMCTEFHDCTCLTVAHRINTIMDADRILVMDKGQVAEFGPPQELVKQSQGIFRSLVEHSKQKQSQTVA